MIINKNIGKCYVCGSNLLNLELKQTRKCENCGELKETNIICEKAHFLCEKCAAKETMDKIQDRVFEYTSKDPLEVFENMMDDCGIYGNSPHAMVTASFLIAYKNLTDNISKEEVLEGIERAKKIPGGWCGFYGTCGAAVGIGTAFAIIFKSTPMSDRERSIANFVTADALQGIAQLGGPRCCVSSARVALISGVNLLEKEMNMEFPRSKYWTLSCSVKYLNSDCRKEKCRFC